MIIVIFMNLYKFRINLIPFLRGVFKSLCLKVFRKNISIGQKTRIKRNTEWRLFPGCYYASGKGLIVGKDVTINVAKGASLLIGDNVGIGNRSQIVSHKSISIGDGTILAPGVMMFDHNHLFNGITGVDQRQFDEGEIVIGKHSWLGAGCIILKNVHIGDNCVIGAGSVVNKDIPSGCIAAGVPATIIKELRP